MAAGITLMSTGSTTPTGKGGNSPSPKKSLGQHWLNDEAGLLAMLEAADVKTSDTVLEIGPGLGSLTAKLEEAASKVIAVEKDERLADSLRRKMSSPKLEIITADILSFDFARLPVDYKLVANIPYYLTSNLIRTMSEAANPPVIAALLVQKEVAERLAAKPGDMSILAVTAQFYWDITLGMVVKANLFEPAPKVDSQIVRLARRQKPLFDVNDKQFFRLVKVGFSQKRKTLTNNLSAGYKIDKKHAASILTESRIEPTSRAQSLSLEDWYQLYNKSNNSSTNHLLK